LAGSSLLALIDDIASVLDDVSVLTKVAAKKTAGVLGDDLALNAQQVAGVPSRRELPVVWAVAKGSFINKAILVTVALLISRLAPWLVSPLLMIGGAFLVFEGCEKLAHKWLHRGHGAEVEELEHKAAHLRADVDVMALEADKIKGAVRTDFVLSAEIIAIALGEVSEQTFAMQARVLIAVGLLMTVGVYGVVAAIVKLDDAGLYLYHREGASFLARVSRPVGSGILRAAPYLMRALSVGGTLAIFLVGGGILVHGIAPLHHAVEAVAEHLHQAPGLRWLSWIVPGILRGLVGVVVGSLLVLVVFGVQRLRRAKPTR